jgi:hypothetical protein
MTKRLTLASVLALAAFAGLVAPASARWYGDGRWHEDNRWNNNRHNHNPRWNGYIYRPPPVVYGTPYNCGYYAPPLIYDNTPSFSITIRP